MQVLGKEGLDIEMVQLPMAGLANAWICGGAANEDPFESVHALPTTAQDGYDVLVDIGAKVTRIVLVRDGAFLACRQLPIGGDQFTEALAQSMGVSFDAAERAKCGRKHETVRRSKPDPNQVSTRHRRLPCQHYNKKNPLLIIVR